MEPETKECEYCCNQILIKARKCMFCQEWQDEVPDGEEKPRDQSSKSFSERHPDAIKPFQAYWATFSRLHYTANVFIVCTLIFFIIQILWLALGEEEIYLVSFALFCIQMMFSWAGLVWVYKLIDTHYNEFLKLIPNVSKKAEHEIFLKHQKIFRNRNMIICGALSGVVAAAGDYYLGTPFVTQEARIIFAVFEFANMFFAGAGAYSLFWFAAFISSLSENSKIKALIISKSNVANTIGDVHLKTAILVLMPLSLGIVAKVVGDWSWYSEHMAWYGFFSLIIIVYIFWPIDNIHRLLVKEKEMELDKIGKKLKKAHSDFHIRASERNLARLRSLQELENILESKNTWPFDLKSLSAVFVSIIFPIFLMIADKWSLFEKMTTWLQSL